MCPARSCELGDFHLIGSANGPAAGWRPGGVVGAADRELGQPAVGLEAVDVGDDVGVAQLLLDAPLVFRQVSEA